MLALFAAAPAQAQPTFAVTPSFAQPMPADDPGGSGSSFTLGAAAAYLPRYEGADTYRLRALPMVSYRNGRFFAGTLGGVGYDFSTVRGVSFGPLLAYRFGRDEDVSPKLRGLGDVDAGIDVGGFVRWNLRPFFVHVSAGHGVGGNVTGTQLRLGAGYATALGPRDRLVLDASLNWADREVMQAYFGITTAQAAASGLAPYRPGAGLRRYGASALWTHAFTPSWFSTVGVGVYRLGSGAAASPIAVDRNAATLTAGLGYRF